MLHLTLRQLHVFQKVASLLNYSQAAKALHMSQPAVSMQIKQLHDNIGLPLLEQMGKKIYLTEAGQELYYYSRAITEQIDELDMVFARLKGIKQGKLRIAVASTANYFAPQLLVNFSQRFPDVTVHLAVTNRQMVLQELADNEADLAIMGQVPEGHDLKAESFMENPLVVIASPGHSLADQKHIPLKRLESETFLAREAGSGTRDAVERFFHEKGIQIKTGMVMSANEAIKQAVQAGMGLGIVSLQTAALELESRRLVVLDVDQFPLIRHWYVVHRSHKRLSPVTSAFKTFLLTEAAGLVPAAGEAPQMRRPAP
ncbi:MAG: LysR family transcriptional regulator [Pseudomonadota bacterium]